MDQQLKAAIDEIIHGMSPAELEGCADRLSTAQRGEYAEALQSIALA